jgi:tetratricopeptide (TPR) repeat protein
LEFSAPKYIYRDERDVLVRQLTPFIKVDDSVLTFTHTNEAARDKILQVIRSASRSESQVNEIKKNATLDNLLDQAQESFNRGQAGRALALYEEILRIDPDHVLAWFNKGNVYHSLNQFAEAKLAFGKTLSINPYYVFGNVALAKAHIATGQPEKVIDTLLPLFKWYPGDTEVRFYLGLAYAMMKNVEQSIVQLKLSVEHNPGFAPAHYYLGLQYNKHDGKSAKKYLRQFLKLAKSGQGQDKMIAKAKTLLGVE